MPRFAFSYSDYNDFEKNIGTIEDRVIRADFEAMVAGNDSFDDFSSAQIEEAFFVFRHGWICARLAMTEPA